MAEGICLLRQQLKLPAPEEIIFISAHAGFYVREINLKGIVCVRICKE
jgi:hypothetical protein